MDRNWELLAPYAGARVTVPALYVAGDRDLVVRFPGVEEAISSLKDTVPRLAGRLMLEGCGHWTQQERPGEVNAALRGFLSEV
jgi:pimeloyl-ACP methyl ester carboxylesterase